MNELAKIVHAADTKDTQAAPEGVGLNALMMGLRTICKDDFEAIEKAILVYDALYAYSTLKLIREKYENQLVAMDSKQQQEFIRKKMQEKL